MIMIKSLNVAFKHADGQNEKWYVYYKLTETCSRKQKINLKP
jgi:hypothetical protein